MIYRTCYVMFQDELLLLKLEIKDEIAKIGEKGNDDGRKLELAETLADYELRTCSLVHIIR